MDDKKIQYLENNISKKGLFRTIEFMGGFDSFDKHYPNYFDNKEKKIELINDICKNEDGERIYFYEITGNDIMIDERFDEDTQHSIVRHITWVEPNNVSIEEWEYDEEGEMFDDIYDRFSFPTSKLDESFINIIFEMLTYYYLNN
jgi:hypothetical protein